MLTVLTICFIPLKINQNRASERGQTAHQTPSNHPGDRPSQHSAGCPHILRWLLHPPTKTRGTDSTALLFRGHALAAANRARRYALLRRAPLGTGSRYPGAARSFAAASPRVSPRRRTLPRLPTPSPWTPPKARQDESRTPSRGRRRRTTPALSQTQRTAPHRPGRLREALPARQARREPRGLPTVLPSLPRAPRGTGGGHGGARAAPRPAAVTSRSSLPLPPPGSGRSCTLCQRPRASRAKHRTGAV